MYGQDYTNDYGSVDTADPVDWDAWRELVYPRPPVAFLQAIPQLRGKSWQNLAQSRAAPKFPFTEMTWDGRSLRGTSAMATQKLDLLSVRALLAGGNQATFSIRLRLAEHIPSIGSSTGGWTLGSGTSGNHYSWVDGNIYLDTFLATRVTVGTGLVADRTRWHEVTITSKPGANGWRFLQNGALYTTSTGDSSITINASEVTIGESAGSYFMNGWIERIVMFDRALSDTQVQNYITRSTGGFRDVLRRVPGRSYFWVGAAPAGSTFTASAAVSFQAATIAASCTFRPGTHTASAAVSTQPATLAATATFSGGTHHATAAISTQPLALSASCTFGGGTHTASAALTLQRATLAASVSFSGGTHTAAGTLTLRAATLTASCLFATAVRQATAALSLQAATLAASVHFSGGTHTASASLTLPSATLEASCTFRPGTHTASAALALQPLRLAAIVATVLRTSVFPGAVTVQRLGFACTAARDGLGCVTVERASA
jgi:hypothetical protein